MTQKTKTILFASDLSINMKQVFEHAVTLSTHHSADIIVLHVMRESSDSQARVKMVFGEKLYKDLKEKQKETAHNILIGKNVDALRIRRAIAGFLGDQDSNAKEFPENQPIKKILVAQGLSIADEITLIAQDEKCDFIVMGLEKKGLIAKTMGDNLVGSVLKRSIIPVLVVPFSK